MSQSSSQSSLDPFVSSTNEGMSHDETGSTLIPQDALILEKKRIVGPIKNGKRSFSQVSVASSASTTSQVDSGVDVNEYEEIPAKMVSQETLEFLGYDAMAAKSIWKLFCDWKDWEFGLEKPPLEDVAFMQIVGKTTNAENTTDDWDQIMKTWGINDQMRKMIMLDEYTDIRLTETAKYWVITAIQGRAFRLQEIFEQSRIRHQKMQKRRREDPSSSEEYIPEDLEVPEDGSPKVSLRGGDPEARVLDLHPSTSGITTLWRGTSKAQAQGLLATNDAQLLYSKRCSDFRGPPAEISYFTPQRQVAVRYAHYTAKQVGGRQNTKLIKIDVPNSFINELKPLLLWFDEKHENSPQKSMFKEILWVSRMGNHYPRHLSQYANRPLYVGNISHAHIKSIRQLRHWQDVTRRHMYDIQEEYWNEKTQAYEMKTVLATQYAFHGRNALEGLLQKGTVHVLNLNET